MQVHLKIKNTELDKRSKWHELLMLLPARSQG